MIVNQKMVIIGFVVAMILVLALGYIIPFFGIYLAMIIAGLLTGYLVNNSIKTGMIHGALIGAFSGIATILLLYLRIAGNPQLAGALIVLAMWYIGIFIILGLVGGALGSLIKQKA